MDINNLKKQITVSVVLIMLGIVLFTKDFVADRREKVFSAMNLELTELLAVNIENGTSEEVEDKNTSDESSVEDEGVEEVVEREEKPKEEVKQTYEVYTGISEIPRINFSKGFYRKESSLNNVKFNIKMLSQSSYPDEDKGNVIIIGHSGNYNNSYFRDLYKLENDDIAIIKYNNKKYTYKIVNIYTDTKDGTVTIYRYETMNCLTLITCTKEDSTKQTIYILELQSVE